MTWVLRCVGLAGTVVTTKDVPMNQYLQWYNPEAHDGLGSATFTLVLDDAIVFDTVEAAHTLLSAVPRNRPLRPDGQPNRPIRAFHLELVPVDRKEP